jgi:cytochrome c biogenesis protein CcdA
MRKLQPHMQKLMVATGVLFLFLGGLMVLGEFAELNNYFARLGFFFGQTESAEVELASGVGGVWGPAIAFFGGVVSFLSPCVLPLVPAYLVNIAGESVLDTGDVTADRRRVFGHALAFVIGFTIVFAIVGASAGLIGNVITERLDTLTRIGGLLLIVLGLQVTGLIHIPYLDRTFQVPQPS